MSPCVAFYTDLWGLYLFYFIYGHWYIETFLYSFQFAKEKSTLIRVSPPVITELDIRPPSSSGIDAGPPLPSQGNQTDAEGNCHTSKKNMHSAYLFCAGAAQHLWRWHRLWGRQCLGIVGLRCRISESRWYRDPWQPGANLAMELEQFHQPPSSCNQRLGAKDLMAIDLMGKSVEEFDGTPMSSHGSDKDVI